MKILKNVLNIILYFCLAVGGVFLIIDLIYLLFGFTETEAFVRFWGFSNYEQAIYVSWILFAVLIVDGILIHMLKKRNK